MRKGVGIEIKGGHSGRRGTTQQGHKRRVGRLLEWREKKWEVKGGKKIEIMREKEKRRKGWEEGEEVKERGKD